MFYEYKADVLDSALTKIKTIKCDLQVYDKTLKFEDDIELDISNRIFSDIDSSINLDNYIKVDSTTYKILKVKKYDDYIETWLYELENLI